MAEPSSSFFQSDPVEEQPHRHTLMVRLVGYLKPYWPGLVALLLLMAAGAVLDVLPSEFTLRLIDHHLAKGSLRGPGPWWRPSWASWCWVPGADRALRPAGLGGAAGHAGPAACRCSPT